MYVYAVLVISSMFAVFSGHVTDEAQNDACPPGVWSCSSGKRSEITKASWDTNLDSLKPSQASDEACPPGVWTCSTGKRSHITKEAKVIAKTAINPNQNDCLPGNWVCKQRRTMTKMMLNACPPGVWTCSTGKRSHITKEAKVTAKTAINQNQNNCPSGNSVCKQRRTMTKTTKMLLNACPPGVWTCSTGK